MKKLWSFILYLNFFNGLRIPGISGSKPALILLRIILPIFFLIFINGCYYYKVNTVVNPPAGRFASIPTLGKTFVVHTNNATIEIDSIFIGNDSIKGHSLGRYAYNLTSYPVPSYNTSFRYQKQPGDRQIYNEIHFFLRNEEASPKQDAPVSFALKDINRLDIYGKDTDKTALSWFFGIIGGILVAFGAFFGVLMMIAIIGGSCPYIYIDSGNGYQFMGEIYSGAIYKPLERNDYLILPGFKADNGLYRLKMTNQQSDEIQNTNLMELLIFDHPGHTQVLVDKYGKYQTAAKLTEPFRATNLKGTGILDLVSCKDSICYGAEPPGKEIPLTDGVVMTFNLPENVEKGKLFIRARNSVWLDHVFKEMLSLLGGLQDNRIKRNNSADPQKLMNWSLEQKIPLSVYILRDSEWQFCDYFHLAGPMALREDVLELDLKGLTDSTLTLKLESGYNFWEIDYAGIDFSENGPVSPSVISLENAVTEKGENITSLLRGDDRDYYVMAEKGNQAELSYPEPVSSGAERTVILHSKGYYQMNLNSKGLPHLAKLNKIRQPGQFPEYSRKLLKASLEELYERGILEPVTESVRHE